MELTLQQRQQKENKYINSTVCQGVITAMEKNKAGKRIDNTIGNPQGRNRDYLSKKGGQGEPH